MHRKIKQVHFQEIPSLFYHEFDEYNVKYHLNYGLHVILKYSENSFHKLYVSSDFKTVIRKSIAQQYTSYDMTAFHVYRYVKYRCNFNGQELKILWKLLRYSNTFKDSIKKLIKFVFIDE